MGPAGQQLAGVGRTASMSRPWSTTHRRSGPAHGAGMEANCRQLKPLRPMRVASSASAPCTSISVTIHHATKYFPPTPSNTWKTAQIYLDRFRPFFSPFVNSPIEKCHFSQHLGDRGHGKSVLWQQRMQNASFPFTGGACPSMVSLRERFAGGGG